MMRYRMHRYHGVAGGDRVLLAEMNRLVDPVDQVRYEIVETRGRLLTRGTEALGKPFTLTFNDPMSANEYFLQLVFQHVN